jgi:hypothetical protein
MEIRRRTATRKINRMKEQRMANKKITRWMGALVMVGMATMAGCAPTRFGGQLWPVHFRAVNSSGVEERGDSVFLISNKRYLDDPTIATDRARLESGEHKYWQGKTPVDVSILDHLWVYVAMRPDGTFSPPVTFNPDSLPDPSVTAEFDR